VILWTDVNTDYGLCGPSQQVSGLRNAITGIAEVPCPEPPATPSVAAPSSPFIVPPHYFFEVLCSVGDPTKKILVHNSFAVLKKGDRKVDPMSPCCWMIVMLSGKVWGFCLVYAPNDPIDHTHVALVGTVSTTSGVGHWGRTQ
jgi:hypothetical protein